MIIVYSYYVLDIVHKGHLEMLRNAKAMAGKDGKLVVGILTDAAIAEKKSKAILSFEERVELARSIEYVDLVVSQDTYSPLTNLRHVRPDVLMESGSHEPNKIVKDFMKSIKGRIITIPYFPGHSSTQIKEDIRDEQLQDAPMLKSLMWRIIGVFWLATITWAFTRDWITVSWVTFVHHSIFLVVFYLHERIWATSKLRPKIKYAVKAVTYEIILGNVILGLITYLVIGDIKQMTGITLTYIQSKLILYYFYEWSWSIRSERTGD